MPFHAASSDAVASAAAPPAPSGSLCGEVVEARVHEGLRFCSGAQAISFGDSPQVHCHLIEACLAELNPTSSHRAVFSMRELAHVNE